jgi:hypothetical protein
MERLNIYREDGRDHKTIRLVKGIGKQLQFKGKQLRELFKKHGIKFKTQREYMIISTEYFIRRILMTNNMLCIIDMINLVTDEYDAERIILLACRYSNAEVINYLLANGMELMYLRYSYILGDIGIDFVAEREDDNVEIAEKVLGDNDFYLDPLIIAAECNNIKIFKFLHQKLLTNNMTYDVPFEEIKKYKLVEILDYLITENFVTVDDIVNLIDNDGKCFEEVIKNRIDDGHLQFSDNQLIHLRQFIDV